MPRNRNNDKSWISLWEEKDKKSDRGPDYTGRLELTEDMVEDLQKVRPDREGKILVRAALWWREGRGGDFLSGEVSIPEAQSEPRRRSRSDDRDDRDDRGRRGGSRRRARGDDDRRRDDDDDRGFRDDPEDSIPF